MSSNNYAGAPPSSGSSSTTTAKDRHYAHLAAQLQALSSNMINAQHHLTAASNQAGYIRTLGANQAAVFMSALHQVDQESGQASEEASKGETGGRQA